MTPNPRWLCHGCGYSLEGLAEGTICPECGEAPLPRCVRCGNTFRAMPRDGHCPLCAFGRPGLIFGHNWPTWATLAFAVAPAVVVFLVGRPVGWLWILPLFVLLFVTPLHLALLGQMLASSASPTLRRRPAWIGLPVFALDWMAGFWIMF